MFDIREYKFLNVKRLNGNSGWNSPVLSRSLYFSLSIYTSLFHFPICFAHTTTKNSDKLQVRVFELKQTPNKFKAKTKIHQYISNKIVSVCSFVVALCV